MATINVTTFNDENNGTGDISLREAIIEANSNAEVDTINLPAGTYTLNIAGQGEDAAATGDLDILDDGGNALTIIGEGLGSTTIDANGIDRVFDVRPGANLSVSELTVTGGQTPLSGAFIDQAGAGFLVNEATLSVSNSSISGNSSNSDGGGIFSDESTVNMTDSTISDNSASFGGGIFSDESIVNITGSTISDNSSNSDGGGIFNLDSTVDITDSSISGNSASFGGGIYSSDSTVNMTDSTISGNSASAGGGIYNSGSTVDVSNSTISDNSAERYGGGIGSDDSIVDITGSTISGNSAAQGGGIYSFYDTVNMTDSTISGNSAADDGGGIFSSDSTVNISNSSIIDNSASFGGGIYSSDSTANITGSTIIDNSASAGGGMFNDYSTVIHITDSTISGNSAEVEGGGILNNQSTVNITGSTISDNSAFAIGGVGNIQSTADITGTTISGNSANYGGGILNSGSTVDITDSTISGNSASFGGGIINVLSTADVSNSTISDNSAELVGGGIFNENSTANITGSTISSNSASAGGGMFNDNSTANITGSTISDNSANSNAGGIFNLESTANITGSTISANSASAGGGILNVESTANITGSTISGNSAEVQGGGVINFQGTANITNSTITENIASTGSGVSSYGNSLTSTTVTSSIISGNTGGGADVELEEPDDSTITDSFISNGNNLLGIVGTNVNAFSQPTDMTGVTDPLLGPLQDNGGPTETHALLPGSPAINAGSNPLGLTTDQRGTGFDREVEQTDIGALELQQLPDIDIEKFTNGVDADTLDNAATVAAGDTVTWTYEVTNTGEVPFDFDEIEVSDDQGVMPVLDTSTDEGSDNILSPGETWTYSASDTAENLNEVIDFEQFSAGDQGATINAGLSGVSISTDWREGLMIFDSANPTGDPDDDLGTANEDFGGPGSGFGGEAGKPGENSIPQSQILILSQDGDPTDPNDNREGGTITFDWDSPVRLNQIGILDIDTYEDGSTVTTFDISGNVIDTYDLQTLGDNSFQIVSMDDIDVSRMEVFFSGSAAITEIDFDNAYQNIGTVTIEGLSDNDSSSYFNPFVGPKNPAPQGDTTNPPSPQPGGSVGFLEAEDMLLNDYEVELQDFASGGQLISLEGTQGSASTTFDGDAGDYTLSVNAFDEIDGESSLKVLVNGVEVGEQILDQNLGGTRATANNLVSKTFDLSLEPGDTIEIQGEKQARERVRFDSIILTPASVNLVSSTPKDELLSGGSDADLFSFTAPAGDDIIQHFEQGMDQLLLNVESVDSFDDLDITSQGSNTIVSFPELSGSITLEGVSSLTSDDVLFSNSNIL
jgi:CSLREA domain-containing protein